MNSKKEIFDCPACGRHYEGLDAFDLRKKQEATGYCCDICEEAAQKELEGRADQNGIEVTLP